MEQEVKINNKQELIGFLQKRVDIEEWMIRTGKRPWSYPPSQLTLSLFKETEDFTHADWVALRTPEYWLQVKFLRQPERNEYLLRCVREYAKYRVTTETIIDDGGDLDF